MRSKFEFTSEMEFLVSGCEILAKVEFLNGGGSVKDRPALYMINEGIESGKVL